MGTPCLVCNGTGTRPGARECFIPRPGHVFIQADYPQLELYTLAQLCTSWLGYSKLADALNAGLDPHTELAAIMLGVPYAEAVAILHDKNQPRNREAKKKRGAAKVANFGAPGGLGVDSLIGYAKTAYGVTLTKKEAKELLDFWRQAWPEMREYTALANAAIHPGTGRASVESLFTRRTRSGMTYCQRCNTPFQGLGADCAREGGWRIARAQYAEPSSVLYGSRVVFMIHDEYISECADDGLVHERAYEQARLMVEGANVYLPDVPIPMSKMEPTAMRRWSKEATQVFDASGRLQAWG